MKAKLSNNFHATINENGRIIIHNKGEVVAKVQLEDVEYSNLLFLIGKHLNRYKSSEVQTLFDMVSRLAFAMKEKLERKWLEGFEGWDDPEKSQYLAEQMIGHLKRGDILDAINFAAFFWNMEEGK
jgi:hypothetical protein